MKNLTKEELNEVNRIRTHLSRIPTCRITTTLRIARQVLLQEYVQSRGEMFDPKAKSLGCGVYEITCKLRKF